MKSINRNSNTYSVELPAGRVYDRDSEIADPITPTPSTSAQQQIGRRGHLRAVPS
mgnify:CR=1 FL=1